MTGSKAVSFQVQKGAPGKLFYEKFVRVTFMNNKTYYQLYGITLLGLVELTIFLQTAQWNFTAAIIKEGGLVESLSALGHFIGVILLGLIRRKPTSYLYGMFFCFSSD